MLEMHGISSGLSSFACMKNFRFFSLCNFVIFYCLIFFHILFSFAVCNNIVLRDLGGPNYFKNNFGGLGSSGYSKTVAKMTEQQVF